MSSGDEFPDYDALLDYDGTPEAAGERNYYGQHDHPMHKPATRRSGMLFQLGDKGRDRVTNFQGIITGRFEFSSGTPRYQLEGLDSTGRPIEHSVDEERIILLETAASRTDGVTIDVPGPVLDKLDAGVAAERELRITEPTAHAIEQDAVREATGDPTAELPEQPPE